MCSVSPAEIEFLAEDELIKITPRFSLEKREFISGDYGPFTPGVPTKVPVWMAINLKQRGLAIVHQPDWLALEPLKEWLENEEMDENKNKATKPLHNHYRELTRIILKNCSDNMKDADEISQIIEDIWNVRIAKLRLSSRNVLVHRCTEEIPANGGIYKIPHYTQLEINFIRTMFLEALTKSFTISKKTTELEQRTDQNPDQSVSASYM